MPTVDLIQLGLYAAVLIGGYIMRHMGVLQPPGPQTPNPAPAPPYLPPAPIAPVPAPPTLPGPAMQQPLLELLMQLAAFVQELRNKRPPTSAPGSPGAQASRE